jgi:hypothetical protein
VVFKVVFGLPLDAAELELFRQCTGREAPPPADGFNEVWLVCGRRAGKSLALATIATFLAVFRDWSSSLAPGERGVVQILASDRSQSRVIYRYARALLTRVPPLAAMIERETREAIDLTNGLSLEITTADRSGARGFTLVAGLCDEVAHWETSETGANPDVEILNALRPAMLTVPGAMLLCASSPYAQRGAMWEAHKANFGKDDSPVLVWQAASRVMHPGLSQAKIDAEIAKDPARGRAEYLALFRSPSEALLPRELVEAAIERGVTVRPPRQDVTTYTSFIDVSGGTGSDSFCAAVGHPEDGKAVLDAVFERRPPFSPAQVCAELRDWLQQYRLSICIGDAYAAGWVVDQLAGLGVTYQHSIRNRSEIYLNALPVFASGRVLLLENERLVNQLVSLERMTSPNGRDRIDARHGHEDLANAVCGVIVLAAQQQPPMQYPNLEPLVGLPASCFDPETGRQVSGPIGPMNWDYRGY